MTRTIIRGGTVVLPDGVLEGGSVVVEGDRIVAVSPKGYGPSGGQDEALVEAHGRLVLPGLVDLHNDAFESEINPRPRANLPLPFALAVLDRRLAASGVTTEFHAIFFADMTRSERRLTDAPLRAATVHEHAAGSRALADHHVLHRVDVWQPESLRLVLAASEAARVPLVSLNDHTPGQGQYRDIDQYRLYLREFLARGPAEVERDVDERMQRAREEPQVLAEVLAEVKRVAAERDLILMSHDDDTPDRVDLMYDLGARIAEFPVTFEAARRQRALGMTITAGAPNIVRGGSASGNISALALLDEGLVDALCADYHAPSLLYAVLLLARGGRMTLPQAVRLVTLNPARAVRLDGDRGSIEPGKRGDVIVVDPSGPAPAVELALRGGRLLYHAPMRAGQPAVVP